MKAKFKTINHSAQFCVIGGGLAGLCAAVTAARHGVSTILMQDRPMYGGNASSEVRMWVCGAKKCMETGLIEEIRLENLYRNPSSVLSIWDSILYGKVQTQKNLEGILNCSCLEADCQDGHIRSVTGWQTTTQCYHKIQADYFADCSGDSVLAYMAGAEYRWGREAAKEFGEDLAPENEDRQTMGLSCIMQLRETDAPQTFIPPDWAYKYPDDNSFPERWHDLEPEQNFWWLELGGNMNSIQDTEAVRDELLKTAFGMWDHIKNRGEHGADNWVLDWVGFLPGKRESRRCIGDCILTQDDVLSGGQFPDVVAYGGWPIDDHHPDGFLHRGAPNRYKMPQEPYGIPLRCLYSRNIDNLYFAGRNISASHVGLSSTRVMATCATLGQAVGTAVFHAVKNGGITPRETAEKHFRDVQETLMEDDAYLPRLKRQPSAICRSASLVASQGNPEPLRNGVDRDLPGSVNRWDCAAGDWVRYDFGESRQIAELRIVFDSDLSRPCWNILANYPLRQPLYEPPHTLVKAFHVTAEGREIYRCEDNYQRLVRIPVAVTAQEVTLHIDQVRGDNSGVFAFEAK